MLKLAKVKENDIVYDLGSGDGRIVITAAKNFGAKAVGVEIDPLRVLISEIKIRLSKVEKKTKIVQKNFFKISLKDADVVTLFLITKAMEKLENKLKKELRKGTRIVSYRFIFKKWKPLQVDEKNKIYLYKV